MARIRTTEEIFGKRKSSSSNKRVRATEEIMGEAKKMGVVEPNSISIKDIAKKAVTAAGMTAATPLFPTPASYKGVQTPPTLTSELSKSPTARGFALDVGQGATYGYLKPALRAAGAEVPETSKTSKIVGQTAGAILSPVTSILGAGTIPAQIGKAAIGGLAYNPSETEISGIKERLPGAALGVAGATVGAGLSKTAQGLQKMITPKAKDALKRALKFGKNVSNVDQKIDDALPLIKEASKKMNIDISKSESALDDFVEAALEAKKTKWNEISNWMDVAEGSGAMIQGDDIANAIKQSVSSRTRKLYPEVVKKINKMADKYKGNLKPSEAEQLLQDVNKEISTFYKKSQSAQYSAKANDDLMAMVAEAKALRNALYSKIKSVSGKDVAPLKRQLGSLMEITDVAKGRINVSQRQQPISLQESLSYAGAAADIFGGLSTHKLGWVMQGIARAGGASIVKRANDANELIKSAFRETPKQTTTPFRIGIGAASTNRNK